MKIFSTLIGYLLQLIYNFTNNYGLSIIILTLITRLVMLPIFSKQITYTAKMNEVQEEVKAIQTKYARDREKMNEEMNKLYAEKGVNPAMGCLPMLIQFPIIIGLFTLLRNPLTYMTQSSMIMAVHESFLWVPDLCQPDSWILPILAGISTYFTTAASSAGAEGAAGMNNAAMKYFYPIMIFLMGRSFPAGLALYWAIGNFFTIGQTLYLNKKREEQTFLDRAEKEAKKNIAKRTK